MENNKNKPKKEKLILSLSILAVLILILVGMMIFYITKNQNSDDKTLAYTDLIKEMSYGNIEKIEMTVGSTSLKVKIKNEDEEKKAIVPNTQTFMELIQSKVQEGNEIELIQNKVNPLVTISQNLFSLLPTLIMIALIVLLFQMQGLGDKGKVCDAEEKDTKTKFDDYKRLKEILEENNVYINHLENAKIVPYIYNMEEMMNVSDLIVARSGAMTITEISNLGKASILIPLPNVSGDHQLHNAKVLENIGGARIILNNELNYENLNSNIEEIILNKNTIETMSKNALKVSTSNVEDKIFAEIKKIVRE